MEHPGMIRATNLPGYDALRLSESRTHSQDSELYNTLRNFSEDFTHRRYLDNPTYDHYLRIHKVPVNSSGAKLLVEIGDELSTEQLPRYLDAAGWAYAEAGLVDSSRSAVERVELVDSAEVTWKKALAAYQSISQTEYAPLFNEHSDSYRLAINLAYAPLIKSIIAGNVVESVRTRALEDTIAIGKVSAAELKKAIKIGDKDALGDHLGFLHETNALLALLYLNDARYIPLPATARADTGYYHRDQTHDITIVNQHWGTIRKVIPVEIKSKASLKDRRRYKALIIRGKIHLTFENNVDPIKTLEAFDRVHKGTADISSQIAVDRASTTVRELLRLYQLGLRPDMVAMNSLMQFHDTDKVGEIYNELSKK